MDGRDSSTRLSSSEPPGLMTSPNSYGASLHNSGGGGGVGGGGGGGGGVPSSSGMMHSFRNPPFNSGIMGKMPEGLNVTYQHLEGQMRPCGAGGSGGGGGLGEPVKKKRGRPRKYGPDGTMALALRPFGSPGSGNQSTPSSDPLAPKRKGRPPGSRNKQHMDALGPPGTGFTPHVITVQAGEDVASKIMSFSQRSPRTVCIISASGSISNVTLRQAATSGGTVTYEGRFEILSLSGSFMFTENGGTRSRTGGLSVSLAGSDGRVLGGSVAGMLLAASPIQVVLGSFIADGKKPKPEQAREPPPSHMAGFGGPMGASTPSQRTSSESSDDPGSPIDESGRVGNNSGHHHMHNMPAYTHLSWGGSHGAN